METEIKHIPKGLHAAEHEVGGIDEVNVTDLTGVLADFQPCAEPATKEFFIPANAGAGLGHRGVQIDAAGEHAYLALLVPQDFTGITNIEIIFEPLETGPTMHFNIVTYYGAYIGGEDYNVHNEVGNNRNIGATVINQNLAHSIADLVDIAALVAGDLLVVDVSHDATVIDSNANVVGIRLRYT